MTEAPRIDTNGKQVPIRLFLPGVNFHLVDGKPTDVSDGECVGVFDKTIQHWVDQKTGRRVYPSQWQPL